MFKSMFAIVILSILLVACGDNGKVSNEVTPEPTSKVTVHVSFMSDYDNPTFAAKLTNSHYSFFSVAKQSYTCNDDQTKCIATK